MKIKKLQNKDFAKFCGLFKSASPSRAIGVFHGCGCKYGYKTFPQSLCRICKSRKQNYSSIDEMHEYPILTMPETPKRGKTRVTVEISTDCIPSEMTAILMLRCITNYCIKYNSYITRTINTKNGQINYELRKYGGE